MAYRATAAEPAQVRISLPLGRMNWLLLGCVAVLMALGLGAIAAVEPGDFSSQLMWCGLGLAVLLASTIPHYERLGRWSYALFAACLAGLVLLFVLPESIARPVNGSRRWIRFGGVGLQPSEFAKVAYVLALAWYLRWRRNYRRLTGLLMPAGLAFVPMVLILRQPDLGTALLFVPAMLAMLFAAGARMRHFVAVVLLCLLALPLVWAHLKPYQKLRISGLLMQSEQVRERIREDDSWRRVLYPFEQRSIDAWATNEGYQVNQAKIALGSGGLLGNGLWDGPFTRKDMLPESHNDFILAIIGHQWGLMGTLVVLLCYLAIGIVGLDVATRTNDPFGRLLVVGLTSLLLVQALLNTGMVVGLLPVTGSALPFVSAGGSSMLANCLCIGLIQNIAARRPQILVRRVFAFD